MSFELSIELAAIAVFLIIGGFKLYMDYHANEKFDRDRVKIEELEMKHKNQVQLSTKEISFLFKKLNECHHKEIRNNKKTNSNTDAL